MVTDKVEKAKLSEISGVKVYIHEQINATREGLDKKIDATRTELKGEINTSRTELKGEIKKLTESVHRYFVWTMGTIIALVITMIAPVIAVVVKTML